MGTRGAQDRHGVAWGELLGMGEMHINVIPDVVQWVTPAGSQMRNTRIMGLTHINSG